MESFNFGVTTSDSGINKAQIIQQIVWRMADGMLQGKYAVNMTAIPQLDYRFTIPTSMYFTPEQIAEGAKADYQNATWFNVSGSLEKYQTRVKLTDETKARQLMNSQMEISLAAAANGLAWKKDEDIFTALGAGAFNTLGANAHWNDDGADPADDIAEAIGKILDTTTITDTDIANINVFYPAKMFGQLAKPIQIGQIQQSLRNWAKMEYNIGLYPTRQLTNTTLAVVKSNQAAMHIMHDGSSVPGAEEVRDAGVGNEFLVTQYFKTLVMPYASGQTTSKYICKITGVDA